MENNYSRLLSGYSQVAAEPSAPYVFLTERHLQAVWMEQKYFKNLRTSKGEPVEIISPGIWNQEAGPDFLKAHLNIDGKAVRGNVEIHLSAEDWYNHGHHQDSRYNQVVLHVSLWEPKSPKPIARADDRQVPQAFLENYLTIPQARIYHLIDLDLYPYKKFVGSGRCARLLFHKMPERKIVDFFRSAAAWRLVQKDQAIRARSEDPSLYVGAGMAMALGYKNNAEAFLRLFLEFYPQRNLGEESILALAFGSCGFFDKVFQEKWGASAYYRHLQALYLMLSLTLPVKNKFKLVLNQVRPFNHPVRRLACLAKLITDDTIPALNLSMTQQWDQEWPERHRDQNWSRLRDKLLQLLPDYQDPYWNHHYFFENEAREEYLPLMGESLKQEMLVNTFLPWIYNRVQQRSNPHEIEAFRNFFGSLPASYSGKTKYLVHRFFGDTPKGELLGKADTEQGAFQLHRDFCIHYEASCEGCPFIQRFKENF